MSLYKKNSPYYTTEVVNGYLDTLNYRNIPAQSDDILFTVTKNYEHRPDLLSFDLYGTPKLWWCFQHRNMDTITDPIWSFTAGTLIRIPKKSTLERNLEI